MSISAAHFNEVTNGYEKQSDGLWVHKGKLSVGPPGPVTAAGSLPGDLSVNRGNNQGAIYFGGLGAANYIYYSGTAWQFAPPLTSSALAPGAATALVGQYNAVTTFSTTTTSSPVATPVSTGSIGCSGVPCRIEFSSAFNHSVAAAAFFSGFMVDGAAQILLSGTTTPGVNQVVSVGWTVYFTPAAGNHTFTASVVNYTAGTLTINTGVSSVLYVTEQRR